MNSEEIKVQIQKYIEEGLVEDANEAIELYKNNIGYDDEIASMEAIINMYSGDYGKAINCIKSGLEVNIFNSDLYFTMGNIYEMKKEYNRAYLCYEHALTCSSSEENAKIIIDAINNLKANVNITVKNYSIVILTYNNLEYTKVCINSIKKYNGYDNCEIIIVDNNSTDGTAEWIKEQEGIKYILNEENKGFPIGCNQGIGVAKRDNDIFLLNNDTVIMPNSIFNLRMGLYSSEEIGATGSISNSVSYYQQINECYDDFDGYINFSLKNNITNENSYEERIKLVGFALLIKRCVLDKVGLLDERFTPGNFEDDDISLRIIMEGYKLLLCKDSYIHHFGSISFKENSEKYTDILKINSDKFMEKWGFRSEHYNSIRYDLIGLMDKKYNEPINILQIGCGTGATLLAIKDKYPNSNLYGIEFNENASILARKNAQISAEKIKEDKINYEDEYFDYIIFSDVFEQSYNLEHVLKVMKRYLKSDGYILVSILNANNYSLIKGLINGSTSYEGDELLNRTNMKLFTKNEIVKIFCDCGYENISVGSMKGYINDEDRKFIEEISKLSDMSIKDEFETYQYLIRVKKKCDQNEKNKRRCSLLIRRIEFEIDVEKSIEDIIQYLKSNLIDENIILDVIDKDIINKIDMLNLIAIKCFENELLDKVIPLLTKAYEISPQDLDTNYNIAYVLNIIGEKELAIEYLNKLETTNNNIEELKEMIGE